MHVKDYVLNTPVVLFIFLREKTTMKIISVLKRCKAPKIYIIGEGPRDGRDNEDEKVKALRQLVEKSIDWDCEVITDYAEKDIGAGNRIATGISFVFKREERAIFIEDDILPNESFFYYCETLLDKYQNDTRIMAISGCNMIQHFDCDSSYFFSQIPFPWGWATWRRAWEGYEYNVPLWNYVKKEKLLEKQFPDKEIYRQKSIEWDLAQKGIDFTWDYQFAFHIMINSGLVIVPKDNLIEYMGFDGFATNSSKNKFLNKATVLDEQLVHPRIIVRNDAFEKEYYNIWFYNRKVVKKKFQLFVKRLITKIFHRGNDE